MCHQATNFDLVALEYDIFIEIYRNKLEVRSFSSLSHFSQPVSSICLSNSLLFVGARQHECCDGSVRVFNLDKQTFIKQFNMINISNNIETASLLVTNLINSSPCPCHTLFIVTYINGQLSNCLTFDVCIKQEKQKRFSSELISFNFKLFIKNAICSLVWNPIEHHLFTCSTMPNQNSQSLYIHNSGELS
ncbi:unnamed protein product, partial [Rotaria magnacalcarata]